MDDELILHQPSHRTFLNRHPEIFDYAARLSKQEPINILSFGCSSGEECYTLREYMPKATIIGAEISLPLVHMNQEKNHDPDITFIHSSFDALKAHGPYDMIFAINVLVRDVTNLLDFPPYIFDYFERQVNQFDALLKPLGHLVLVHTQHDFTMTDLFLSGKYKQEEVKEFYGKVREL